MGLKVMAVYLYCAITMAIWNAVIFRRQIRANCRCHRLAQFAARCLGPPPITVKKVRAWKVDSQEAGPGDAPPRALPSQWEFREKVRAAQADAEVVVGWLNDAVPYHAYDSPGVAVQVGWMDISGDIQVKVLWIHPEFVPQLLDVAHTVLSDDIRRRKS